MVNSLLDYVSLSLFCVNAVYGLESLLKVSLETDPFCIKLVYCTTQLFDQ